MDKSIDDLGKIQGTAAAYLAIARLDHSTKHKFIIPGVILAYLLRGIHTTSIAQFRNTQLDRRDLHCVSQLRDKRMVRSRV